MPTDIVLVTSTSCNSKPSGMGELYLKFVLMLQEGEGETVGVDNTQFAAANCIRLLY